MSRFIQYENTPVLIENIFCIGRNYINHIKELNNQVETEPLVFMKPTSSILTTGEQPIRLPEYSQNVHYECEIVILIGQDAYQIDESQASKYIQGYGIGLDLTARDTQSIIKEKGLPWLKAKGFPHACCISDFIAPHKLPNLNNIEFTFSINNQLRQHGFSQNMIYSIPFIISYLSKIYGLQAGDLIFTGTPEGVGQLHSQDKLNLNLNNLLNCQFQVA